MRLRLFDDGADAFVGLGPDVDLGAGEEPVHRAPERVSDEYDGREREAGLVRWVVYPSGLRSERALRDAGASGEPVPGALTERLLDAAQDVSLDLGFAGIHPKGPLGLGVEVDQNVNVHTRAGASER